MAYDKLSLSPRLPLVPSTSAPTPLMAPASAPTAEAPTPSFQSDAYVPSPTRTSATVAPLDPQALMAEIGQLRERLNALNTQLEQLLGAWQPTVPLDSPDAPHSDDATPPADPDPSESDATAPAPVDHAAMMKDEASIRQGFATTDTDGNGVLSFEEVVAHEDGDRAKATMHFTDADANQDQQIDEAEWVHHHLTSPLHVGPGAEATPPHTGMKIG